VMHLRLCDHRESGTRIETISSLFGSPGVAAGAFRKDRGFDLGRLPHRYPLGRLTWASTSRNEAYHILYARSPHSLRDHTKRICKSAWRM
jgi:hypothetical protein